MITILIMFWKLKCVAVVDILCDVPVVCGSSCQSPETKHLPGCTRFIILLMVVLHCFAHLLGQAGQLAPTGMLFLFVAPGVDEDTAIRVDGDCRLDVVELADVVPQGD